MKKVLWISNYGYKNSYCDVTKTLLRAFVKHCPDEVELYLLGIGQTQEVDFSTTASKELGIPPENIFCPIIFTKNFSAPEDAEFMKNHILGMYCFDTVYKKVKPDIVISLNDVGPFLEQKKMADKIGMKIIPYIPCDVDDTEFAENVPAVITPSGHSQINLEKNVTCPVYLLPHIITKKGPDLDKKDVKRELFNDPDCFVVVAVNRNNVRKRWDMLFQAFQQFAADKDDVRLLCKTDALDKTERFASITAPQYDMSSINNPKIKIVTEFLTDDELNKIYNCGDVGLTMTSGEGFGLTPCELSLYKIPSIVPRNTSHPWLFGEDYGGMVSATRYSTAVARSFLPLNQIENDLICAMKIYMHVDETTENVEHLELTEGITSMVLSPYKMDNVECFDSVEKLIQSIDAVADDARVQILVYTNLDFMKTIDFDKLYNLKIPGRKIYTSKIATHYTSDVDLASLASITHAVELLNKCYNDREYRDELAAECFDRINGRFTEEKVAEMMKDILKKL